MRIPAGIVEIDNDWLGAVVGAPVASFAARRIGEGVGIMGDIYCVNLSYQDDARGPASVVVKLPSSFEENRAQGVALGMFEAEVRFYNEMAHKANVGMPRIYHADIVSGTADFVIVMEDLSDYLMVGQTEGMNLAQASITVEVLAAIHATWWNAVQTPELDWIPAMNGPRIAFVDEVLPGVFANFADGFGQYLPEGGLAVFEAFVGNYLQLTRVLAGRSPWTLAHQDFRVENLLFGCADHHHPLVVLDWQGIGRGPGVYDLAYVLGGSMQETLRQTHEMALLDRYHACLCEQGVDDYSLAQCRDDYRLAHLMGGLATPILLGGAMDLSNERGVQLVATMASRHVRAALDHDGLALLREHVH